MLIIDFRVLFGCMLAVINQACKQMGFEFCLQGAKGWRVAI